MTIVVVRCGRALVHQGVYDRPFFERYREVFPELSKYVTGPGYRMVYSTHFALKLLCTPLSFDFPLWFVRRSKKVRGGAHACGCARARALGAVAR